jgi:hypothetical protein
MPVRFSGIRLLLAFVAINTVMILMLVTSMTSKNPWLAHVLPGQFHSGGNFSGYWVFFSLVLLVDAITVLVAALILLLPARNEAGAADLRYVERHLSGRAGISAEAGKAVIAAMAKEIGSAGYQLAVGRGILVGGALFLIVAFAAMTLSFARALPDNAMFARQCIAGRVVCDLPARSFAIENQDVRAVEIGLYTLDQIGGAVLFDAPEIYDWHIGTLANNTRNGLFSHFAFAFRTLLSLVTILTVLSFGAGGARKPPEAPVEAEVPPPDEAAQPK